MVRYVFEQEKSQMDNQEKLHDILLAEDELTLSEREFIEDITESIEADIPLTEAQQDWFNLIYDRVT